MTHVSTLYYSLYAIAKNCNPVFAIGVSMTHGAHLC
uniref:Uncharacterized protein n=1 Tax=Arundo donax TaxID=35708 RepID=A0A0A9EA94_ARUDO